VIRIASEEHGSGFPLLLVMGQGYGRWAWEPILEPLAERFRVISYDPRGVGGSDKPDGPYTVEQLTADALQVLDERGVERAHVVGVSLGGMVAQLLAIEHPGRVDRLALLATGSGFGHPVPMPASLFALYAEVAGLDADAATRRFVENAVTDRGEVVEQLLRRRREHPIDPSFRDAQGAAAIAFDSYDRLDRIAAPTLVLTGDEDNVIDWRNSELLVDRLPNARLQVFHGTGHLFFWERPNEVAAALTEFFA
jgi:pimeloyl-ACP methyl ester carboxylesterase